MLKKLFKVQQKDLEIDNISKELKLTPPELIQTLEQFQDLEARLESTKDKYLDLHSESKAIELEIADLESRRQASSDSALSATTNKEVSQYQNQALQFATRIQELEEDVFPILEKMESTKEKLTKLEEEHAELKPVLEEMQTTEEKRIQEIHDRLASYIKEREILAKAITPSLLKQYEQVRRARRGVGMATINGKSCGGCSVQLPIFVIQQARKDQGVTRCPSCGRILWAQNSK
ncbi:MAG TPA: hypothetical protein ENK21_05825 [Trueperaceae bacterium]|nr:hypothetical protein [Trueperaceae bacterium]